MSTLSETQLASLKLSHEALGLALHQPEAVSLRQQERARALLDLYRS